MGGRVCCQVVNVESIRTGKWAFCNRNSKHRIRQEPLVNAKFQGTLMRSRVFALSYSCQGSYDYTVGKPGSTLTGWWKLTMPVESRCTECASRMVPKKKTLSMQYYGQECTTWMWSWENIRWTQNKKCSIKKPQNWKGYTPQKCQCHRGQRKAMEMLQIKVG